MKRTFDVFVDSIVKQRIKFLRYKAQMINTDCLGRRLYFYHSNAHNNKNARAASKTKLRYRETKPETISDLDKERYFDISTSRRDAFFPLQRTMRPFAFSRGTGDERESREYFAPLLARPCGLFLFFSRFPFSLFLLSLSFPLSPSSCQGF